jgi:hypothetical protein
MIEWVVCLFTVSKADLFLDFGMGFNSASASP